MRCCPDLNKRWLVSLFECRVRITQTCHNMNISDLFVFDVWICDKPLPFRKDGGKCQRSTSNTGDWVDEWLQHWTREFAGSNPSYAKSLLYLSSVSWCWTDSLVLRYVEDIESPCAMGVCTSIKVPLNFHERYGAESIAAGGTTLWQLAFPWESGPTWAKSTGKKVSHALFLVGLNTCSWLQRRVIEFVGV